MRRSYRDRKCEKLCSLSFYNFIKYAKCLVSKERLFLFAFRSKSVEKNFKEKMPVKLLIM
jgi:hypothetical protein